MPIFCDCGCGHTKLDSGGISRGGGGGDGGGGGGGVGGWLSGGTRVPPTHAAAARHPVGLPLMFLWPSQQPHPEDAPQEAFPHCHVAHAGLPQQAEACRWGWRWVARSIV